MKLFRIETREYNTITTINNDIWSSETFDYLFSTINEEDAISLAKLKFFVKSDTCNHDAYVDEDRIIDGDIEYIFRAVEVKE